MTKFKCRWKIKWAFYEVVFKVCRVSACRQRENGAQRQLVAIRKVHAGVLRRPVQNQRLRHPGLPARAVAYHRSVQRRAQLPRLLPTFGRRSGPSVI